MIKEMWRTFPRLIEEKIQTLLDEAGPNPVKAFQLYKTCQEENLWRDSYEKFSKKISAYFDIPAPERRKSSLDAMLDRPINIAVYDNFKLNFRSALVETHSIAGVANWTHNLMRVSRQTESEVISQNVFVRALEQIVNPTMLDKAHEVNFEDFCESWKKAAFKLFGKKYDTELEEILKELRWFNTELKRQKHIVPANAFYPTIYMTQTEIDWVLDVQKTAHASRPVPQYPLSRGAQSQRLIELDRTIRLYNIVQTTKLPEFIKHRENIRATILDRCLGLMRDKAS